MKHIISILGLILIANFANAQSLTPFFWQPNIQEFHNMSRMSGSYVTTKQDTAGATVDTVYLSPHFNNEYIVYTPKDSSAIAFKSLKGVSYGDKLILDITSPSVSSNFVYLFGKWVVSTGSAKITLTTGKRSRFVFEFDGVDFIEISRNLNYTPD